MKLILRIVWVLYVLALMCFVCYDKGSEDTLKNYYEEWPKTYLNCALDLKPGTYDLTRTIYMENGGNLLGGSGKIILRSINNDR